MVQRYNFFGRRKNLPFSLCGHAGLCGLPRKNPGAPSLLLVLNRSSKSYIKYEVVHYKKRRYSGLVWILVLSLSFIATLIFYSNIEMISYQALVQNGAMGNEDTTLAAIDALFKALPTFAIFPVFTIRKANWCFRLFAVYNIILSFVYNILSGSRSDILAITLGLVLIWMYGRKIRFKQILILGLVAIIFLILAGLAFALRGGSNDGTLAETLLQQDYSGPAYNILAVIGKDIVDPLLVVKSQFLKLFPLLGGDWLYMPIGKRAFSGVEMSGSQSMGFHPFVEGYMFAGFIGFIYNGIVVGLGLMLWKRFMSTNDERFNRYMFAVMGCLFFALVREQTIWFVRYIYYSFIPAVFVYSRLSNIEIHYSGFFRKHE